MLINYYLPFYIIISDVRIGYNTYTFFQNFLVYYLYFQEVCEEI